MKVLHGVNLEASFEKLKVSLNDARKSVKRNNTDSYAYAFGYLETAVVKHLESVQMMMDGIMIFRGSYSNHLNKKRSCC
jgi:hypothetical protein